jgi:hypothetical protein
MSKTPTPIVSDVDELSNKIDGIMFDNMGASGWNGSTSSYVYVDAKKALMALITAYTHDRETEIRLAEREEVALDNYHGHTFSDSTNWQGKFDKFIKNNEKRITALKATRKDGK